MLTILFFSSFGFCEEDSIKTHTDSSAITVVQPDSSRVLKHLFDPKVAAISSLIPGGGQVYTKHYIKAGIFVAAEIGVGLLGYQRYIWQKDLRHAADSVSGLAKQYADSVQHDSAQGKAIDTLYRNQGIDYQLEADRDRYDEKAAFNVVEQCVAWAIGIYYYNIMDAIHATEFFKDDNKRNPMRAGLLSAIPGLGLGQIYNGELSKAGMILMTQLNMGLIAFNYQRIMTDCENYEAAIYVNTPKGNEFTAKGYSDDWESRRQDAFKNRNMWIWYSLGFYFYSIFDAIVDAHLHDANVKMKLEPDLVPQSKLIGLSLTMPF